MGGLNTRRKTLENKTTMGFGQAFDFAKNGNAIARKAFRDTCHVKVQWPDAGSANTLPYLYMEKGDHRFPVDLSCESLFADDWYVLEDK